MSIHDQVLNAIAAFEAKYCSFEIIRSTVMISAHDYTSAYVLADGISKFNPKSKRKLVVLGKINLEEVNDVNYR